MSQENHLLPEQAANSVPADSACWLWFDWQALLVTQKTAVFYQMEQYETLLTTYQLRGEEPMFGYELLCGGLIYLCRRLCFWKNSEQSKENAT